MAPFRDEVSTLQAYQALCAMAVLAWHLSSLPDAEIERDLAQAIRDAHIADQEVFRGLVGSLIERKKRLFPDDTRLIAGHEVTATPNGFRLVVASVGLGPC